MFAHFRRHRWLWVIIFGATILSFVWWLGPAVGSGGAFRGGRNDVVGHIYGHPVTMKEYSDMKEEAILEFFFRNGARWPTDIPGAEAYIQRATRDRLVLMDQVKSFGIRVSDETKVNWISDTFSDPARGGFSKARFDEFKNTDLPQARLGLQLVDFERFVEHQVAIQHLVSIVGGGGMVTPQEAELRYRREFEEVDTELALFSVTNFLAQLTNEVARSNVETFYTNNQARYRVPEKRVVRYLHLDATNFLAEANVLLSGITNLELAIEATYTNKGGTNFYLDENSKPLSFEAAKEVVRGEIRKEAEMFSAQKKAIEFANELLDKPASTNLLRTFAEGKGVPSEVSKPFGEYEQPEGLRVPSSFAAAGFKLSEANPLFDQPIVGEDAVYLIALDHIVSSQVPPFEELRDRLYEDYRRYQAEQLCNQAGTNLFLAITNGIAQGKTFEAIVGTNAEYIDLPKFSRQTMSIPGLGENLPLRILQTYAFKLLENQTAPYTETPTGGYILRLQRKVAVPDDRLKESLPGYMERQRGEAFSSAVNAWFTKQMEAANPDLPGDERPKN